MNVNHFKVFLQSLLIKHGIGDDTEFRIRKPGDIHSFILHVFSIKHFSVSKHLTPATRSFWSNIDFFGNLELSATFTKKDLIQAQKDLQALLSLQINHVKADYLIYIQSIHPEMIEILEK
jgi:hypothetical protein